MLYYMKTHVLQIRVSIEELEALQRRAGREPLSSYCRRVLLDPPSAIAEFVENQRPADFIEQKAAPRVKRGDLCGDCERGRHLACKGKQCGCGDPICAAR